MDRNSILDPDRPKFWSGPRSAQLRHELNGPSPDAYFALFLQFCCVAAGAMTRKVRKKPKKLFFRSFQVLKIDIFARKTQNRWKMDKVKAPPPQIDPRGFDGAYRFVNLSYRTGKNSIFVIFLWFLIFLMHIFARNSQTRSKIDQLKAGPYQIDARGSHAAKIFEFYSYYAGG